GVGKIHGLRFLTDEKNARHVVASLGNGPTRISAPIILATPGPCAFFRSESEPGPVPWLFLPLLLPTCAVRANASGSHAKALRRQRALIQPSLQQGTPPQP